jgi:putative hydrolase of the HAD superfamily
LGCAVDLDDTLYPQHEYLQGAITATAARAGTLGLPRKRFAEALAGVLAQGSDAGKTIDRALEELGLEPPRMADLVGPLVQAFASYRPIRLRCYGQARQALGVLRQMAPVALVTDGRPEIQRAKLSALGLEGAFDLVVLTDEAFGRERRKPDPASLLYVATKFAVTASELLVIGDRVDKDVELARRCGASVIRVRTGEYSEVPTPDGVAEVATFAAAVELVGAPTWRTSVQ